MANTVRRDFYMTDDGDIALAPVEYYNAATGVVEMPKVVREIEGKESMMQTVKIRLMSSDPDVPDIKYTDFCANLEDLLGKPNTLETANKGMQMITHCLTFDGLVSPDNLYVRPTPINNNEIVFFVLIKDEKDVLVFEVVLNLEDGVRIGRVGHDIIS